MDESTTAILRATNLCLAPNGGVHLEWMMEQGYLVSLPERHASIVVFAPNVFYSVILAFFPVMLFYYLKRMSEEISDLQR